VVRKTALRVEGVSEGKNSGEGKATKKSRWPRGVTGGEKRGGDTLRDRCSQGRKGDRALWT